MNCDVGEPTSQLILQPFRRFTYITAHPPTLLLLHLRHSSFSNTSFASLKSQVLHLIHLASRPWPSQSNLFLIKYFEKNQIDYIFLPILNKITSKKNFNIFFLSSGQQRVKMYLREVGCDPGDQVDLAQDKDQSRTYVRALMNLRVP